MNEKIFDFKNKKMDIYLWHKDQKQRESCTNQYTNSHNGVQRLMQFRVQQHGDTNHTNNRYSKYIINCYGNLLSLVLNLYFGTLQLPSQKDSDQQQNTFVATYANQKLDEILAITAYHLSSFNRIGKEVFIGVDNL